MKYLLDTSTFIWAMTNPDRLSAKAESLLGDTETDLHLSVISLWEIEIKTAIGKMPAMNDLQRFLDRDSRFLRFEVLDLKKQPVHELPTLPFHHKDPFDRILICQAKFEGMTLVSPDRVFQSYPVPSVW